MKFTRHAFSLKPYLISTLLALSLFTSAQAQIISADTICVNTPANFYSQQQNTMYTWMLDTLNINQTPSTLQTVFSGAPLSTSAYATFNNDSGNFYSFVTNSGTLSITRLSFGNNPNNTPVATDMGGFGLTLSQNDNFEGIDVVKDTVTNTWYGVAVNDTQLLVLNFGTSLANTPTAVVTAYPAFMAYAHQITLKKYNGDWIAFVADKNGSISRLDFGSSLTNTATGTLLPTFGIIANPCDFVIHEQAGTWYMLINNLLTGKLIRLNFGSNLENNNPTPTDLGNPGGLYAIPRPITMVTNCSNELYAYTINESGELIKLDFGGDITNNPVASDLGNIGTTNVNALTSYTYGNILFYFITSWGQSAVYRYAVLNLPPSAATFYYNANYTHTFTAAGTYNITLFNDQSYQSDGSAFCKQVVVVNGGNAVASMDTTICQGTSLTLYAGTTGTQVWSTGDTTSSIVVTQPGTYYVSGSNFCGTLSDTFHVKVENNVYVYAGPDTTTCINFPLHLLAHVISPQTGVNYTYQWSPDTYINDNTLQGPIVTPPSDTYYSVIALQNGDATCSVPDSVLVTVLQGYTLLNHDTAICTGASVQLNAIGDPRYTYTWSPPTGLSSTSITNPVATPDTTTTYSISAYFPGCVDSVTTVTIDVQPIPIITAPDMAKCLPDTLQFTTYVAPSYPNYTFLWTPGNALNDSTVLDPYFFGDTSTFFHIVVSTPIGCTDTDSVMVTVYPGSFSHLLTGDTAICPGDSVQLVDTGGMVYDWVPATGLSDTSIANPFASPTSTTYYTLYIKDEHGCRDTQFVNVVVYPAAVLDLGDSVILYPGESHQMDPQTNCINFSWFPPFGLTATNISNPIASPDVNTKYIVTASTQDGCIAVDSIDVHVDPTTLITLPNAFTPGNGPNNILKVIYRGAATLNYLRIYNRWGNMVFKTSNINDGWDGTYKGAPQPFGVYVYELEAVTANGRSFSKQGNVTLLR